MHVFDRSSCASVAFGVQWFALPLHQVHYQIPDTSYIRYISSFTKDPPPSGNRTQPSWIYCGTHRARETSYAEQKAAILPTSPAHQVYTGC